MYMDFINSKTFKNRLGYPEGGKAEMYTLSLDGDQVLFVALFVLSLSVNEWEPGL